MHKFTVDLKLSTDTENQPVFGFSSKDIFISDPFVSDCGRFEAHPTDTYGISLKDARALVRLNKALATAIEAAVNAGCKVLQDEMGIESGDVAGIHFSNTDNRIGIAESLGKYFAAELASQ